MKSFSFYAPLITLALVAGTAANVSAQEWKPASPVRVVVPYPPGGGTDVVARLMTTIVGDGMGQPMIIDNRPGANGVIGANTVYSAKGDGQTLLFGVSDIISTTPHVNKKAVTFNPDGFSGVAPVATGGYVLISRKDHKTTDLVSLVSSAKVKGAHYTYAHWGAGSMGQMAMEMLKLKAGIPDMLAVPYPGSAATVNAVLSGQVDYAFVPPGLAAANEATLRLYAISSQARIPLLKDLPTLKERGYDVTAETWYGVVAPPGTPKNVVDSLNKSINKAIGTPSFATRLTDLGYTPMTTDATTFEDYIKVENKLWGQVVSAAQLKVEQ